MSDFIQLKCTNCGGVLVQNSQDNTYTCKMCGAKYMLKFEHGGIQIERILDAKLQSVQEGVGVLASEMAIQRLREEIRTETQTIAKMEMILRKGASELQNDHSSITQLESQLAEVKIPKEFKYNLIHPIIRFLLTVFPISCGMSIVLAMIVNWNINFFVIYLLIAIIFAVYYGSNIRRAMNNRSRYLSSSQDRLHSERQHLENKRRYIEKSIEEAKSHLPKLKLETAEKQKELEWHLQNVKTKRT